MVYCQVYGANQDDVEFLLVPMPRLEIETIQDFKVLFEIGALTPDMTVKLSRILLGEEPGSKKSRKAAQPAVGPSEPFPEKVASGAKGQGFEPGQTKASPPDPSQKVKPDKE